MELIMKVWAGVYSHYHCLFMSLDIAVSINAAILRTLHNPAIGISSNRKEATASGITLG